MSRFFSPPLTRSRALLRLLFQETVETGVKTMRQLIRTITLALAGLALAAHAAADVPKRYRMVDIMDNQGFERPMRAARMLVPADWQTSGSMDWMAGRQRGQSGPVNTFSAVSPDGLSSLAFLPTFCLARSNMPGYNPSQFGCRNGTANGAQDMVGFLTSLLPNGRIVNVQRDPAMARQLTAMGWEMQGDPYSRYWMDAVVAEVSYTYEGRAYRGLVLLMSTHNYMKSGHSFAAYGYGYDMPGMPAVTETSFASAGLVFAYGAPVEDFDPGMFTLLLSNYRADPNWSRRMAVHWAKINDMNIETARKISEINRKANAEISRMQRETWNAQQKSFDNSSRDINDTIAGIWDYTTSDGSIISVPEHAGDLVEMPDGSFVITDIDAVKLEGTVLDWAPGRNFRD